MTMETSRWKPLESLSPLTHCSYQCLQRSLVSSCFIPRKLTMKVRKEGKTNTTGRKKTGCFSLIQVSTTVTMIIPWLSHVFLTKRLCFPFCLSFLGVSLQHRPPEFQPPLLECVQGPEKVGRMWRCHSSPGTRMPWDALGCPKPIGIGMEP